MWGSRASLINRSFEKNASAVFEVFSSLAEDGKVSLKEGSDSDKIVTETKEIDALFAKYNVPENDKTEIVGILTNMLKDMDANFKAEMEGNTALGPIILDDQK